MEIIIDSALQHEKVEHRRFVFQLLSNAVEENFDGFCAIMQMGIIQKIIRISVCSEQEFKVDACDFFYECASQVLF